MDSTLTFVDVVHTYAAARPAKTAYTFLPDRGGPPSTLSYAALDVAASAVAATLLERGAAGKRVLLLFPGGREFLEAFLGCLYAGATAVPAPPPATQRHHVERLLGIIRDADVALALTRTADLPVVEQLLAAAGAAVPCLPTDSANGNPVGSRPGGGAERISPDTLAFLQYTSGSTRTPKGVMVSHGNLLANLRVLASTFRLTEESVIGGWLPPFHDMGLIGQLLSPVFSGGSAVVLPTHAFLREPGRWLEEIGKHGITISGGPNFSYDLCTRRIPDERIAHLDLSSWAVAFNGSEPVRAETLRAFAARFAPAGFRPDALFPCYGLAEATLVVSGGSAVPGHPPRRVLSVSREAIERGRLSAPRSAEDEQVLVSSGAPRGAQVHIVDPLTSRVLPSGTVGEIWVCGPSVAQGYWRAPDPTAETFGARPDGSQEPHLRTGDLGALVSGELFVVGRLTEAVIIAGRNIYPQDVEEEVREAHPALAGRPGAAFGVDVGEEHLVVVHEVRTDALDGLDLPRVTAAVRRHLGERLGLRPGGVALVPPRTVPRTTSGKIQRTLTRHQFCAGDLPALHEELHPVVSRRFREPAPTAGTGGS